MNVQIQKYCRKCKKWSLGLHKYGYCAFCGWMPGNGIDWRKVFRNAAAITLILICLTYLTMK